MKEIDDLLSSVPFKFQFPDGVTDKVDKKLRSLLNYIGFKVLICRCISYVIYKKYLLHLVKLLITNFVWERKPLDTSDNWINSPVLDLS